MANETYLPLKASPLEVIAHEFLSMAIHATPAESFGTGDIQVQRHIYQDPDQPKRWVVLLIVELVGEEGEDAKAPPYTGKIIARGVYEMHESFQGDAERLIRINGASMLYGAIREMIATFTSRSANGPVTLPSISFFEEIERREN
jgi:preprotein translocase subunit SecB